MRIFKASGNIAEDMKRIAKELYNIESATLTYDDGVKLETPVKGYPKIVHNNVQYTFNAVEGYIYIASGMSVSEIEAELVGAFDELEAKGEFPQTHLKEYQTMRLGNHTNVRVRSTLAVTAKNSEHIKNNIKRQFCTITGPSTKRARFTWRIVNINSIDYMINSLNIDSSLSRLVFSVFYDSDNISKLENNAIVQDFNSQYLKGSDKIIDIGLMLTKYGNPLGFELSSFWKNCSSGGIKMFRDIPRGKIYACDYDKVKIKPTIIDDASGETSTDVCGKCRSVLHGDNYVLMGSVQNPDNEYGRAICPLCLHTSSKENPLEMKYFRILRVTFPLSTEDLIAKQKNENLRDIYREAMCGVKYIKDNDNNEYVLIGEKYVGVVNTHKYLYSAASVNEFGDRKVCSIYNIELLE
jgi:hypothetical protein